MKVASRALMIIITIFALLISIVLFGFLAFPQYFGIKGPIKTNVDVDRWTIKNKTDWYPTETRMDYLNDFFKRFPLFISTTTTSTTTTTETSSGRSCFQCISGNFENIQGMFHHSAQDFAETDCWSGKMKIYEGCKNTCVMVRMQKLVNIATSIYDAVLLDCSDDLIYDSPKTSYFSWIKTPLTFTEDSMYFKDQDGFRTIFEFHTQRPTMPWMAVMNLQGIVTNEMLEDAKNGSTLLYTIVIFASIIWGLFLIFLVVYVCFICFKNYCKKPDSKKEVQNETELEERRPSVPPHRYPWDAPDYYEFPEETD